MKLWAEFKKFITRGNVVDMAVGVAVAGAFTKIVTAFTNGFVGPIIALFSKDANLTEFKWILREAVTHMDETTGLEVIDTPEVAILWGAFLQTILDFLIIAATLFLVMKIVASVTARAKAIREDMTDELKSDKQKAEEAEAAAQKAAEEEAAKKAEEEAAAAAAQQAAAEKQAAMDAYAAQVAMAENTEKLLSEIRDLLKKEQ